MRFDDMIDTVLGQPLASGVIRATVYRQLVDLIAQGRAEHNQGLADRAYAAIEELRMDVPLEARAGLARSLKGVRVPARLVLHFGTEEVRYVAAFLSAVALTADEWLSILSTLPPQARSLLRSRRDLPERVAKVLESFGPADLALAPPEEPELPWNELWGEGAENAVELPVNDAPRQPVSLDQGGEWPVHHPAPAERRVDNLFSSSPATIMPVQGAEPERDPALVASETQVRELLRRIEAFRSRTPHSFHEGLAGNDFAKDEAPGQENEDIPVADPRVDDGSAAAADAALIPPSASIQGFRWESDGSGTIVWVEGVAREAVIGRSVALSEPEAIEGVDMRTATAFARRAPFRDGRLRLPGSGEASGLWLISGVPFFDSANGRFGGFRGTARRFEDVPQPSAAMQNHPKAGTKPPPSPDAIRQMAHELRTPLNAIVGFAEMIDRQMLGPAAQSYRDRAQDILGDAHRLLAAIDDMDATARSDGAAGEGPPLVDAGSLVERVIGRYRGLSRERGIDLIGSIAIGLPAIETSEEVLERVVGRLFAAVIGAARAGDRLTYGVGAGEGDSVRIFLSRPAALAGRDAEALYDPASAGFAAGLEAPALGLGFGLRLVRQLASALGGKFDIEDTLFMLTLPCSRSRLSTAGHVA